MTSGVAPGGKPPYDGGMDDTWKESVNAQLGSLNLRFGGIEEKLKHIPTSLQIVGLFVAMTALLLAFGYFAVGRIDRVDDRLTRSEQRLEALPGQINQNLQSLTATLADAITASKQQVPQVILIPAPKQP
jgi:hypothetical protein